MGYRSEVAYAITFETRKDLSEFIATIMAVGTDHQRDALKECHINWTESKINFYASDTKWYDDFNDVQAHVELMELSVERNASWRFLRIGEDSDDTEERFGGSDSDSMWDDFSLIRRIHIGMDVTAVGDALSAEIPEGLLDTI